MNPRPLPCQGSALPLRHSPPLCYPLSAVNAGDTAAVFTAASPGRVQQSCLPAFTICRLSEQACLLTVPLHQIIYGTSSTSNIICTAYSLVNSTNCTVFYGEGFKTREAIYSSRKMPPTRVNPIKSPNQLVSMSSTEPINKTPLCQ